MTRTSAARDLFDPAKTMVIVGDADGVKLEHALAIFKLRGEGR
jgi:hypothetical protein